jgi:hypothetical protein
MRHSIPHSMTVAVTDDLADNVLRSSINGFSSLTLLIIVYRSLRQTQNRCRNPSKTRNHSTPASVKQTTYHVPMMFSLRASLGPSSRTTSSCATLLKLRWTWRETTRFGFISAKHLPKRRHNSQRIQRNHAITRRVISWIQSPSHPSPYQGNLMPLHIPQVSVRILWQEPRHRFGHLCLQPLAPPGQRSPMYTSLEILMICTVLIHKLTVLSKTSFSEQHHTVSVPIRDGDQPSRILQLRMCKIILPRLRAFHHPQLEHRLGAMLLL